MGLVGRAKKNVLNSFAFIPIENASFLSIGRENGYDALNAPYPFFILNANLPAMQKESGVMKKGFSSRNSKYRTKNSFLPARGRVGF